MKKRWRRPFSWYFIWFLFFLIAASSLLVGIINLPVWQIREIQVVGTQILSPEEIKTLAAIPLNENLFLANFERTKNNLQKIIAIKKLRISRIPPATIRLNIEERRPLAVVVFKDESAIIDEEGYILNSNRNLTLNIVSLVDLPVVFGLEKDIISENRGIEIISGIILELTKFYEPKKLQIEYKNFEDISFLLDDLLRVRVGKGEDISKKMFVFKRLLLEIQGKLDKVEYVDVRFPDSPCILFKM